MARLLKVTDEQAMLSLGARLADVISGVGLVFLKGDLGAGKSTLVRGFMQGLGFTGRVKSPTFTLVEPYEIDDKTIYHMDLYRLADPEELEFIGIRDMLDGHAVCLVEWPEKASGMLGEPDIIIDISYLGESREVRLSASNDSVQQAFNEL